MTATSPLSPRARLALGSFWTVAGTGIHMAAGMLAGIVAARMLGAIRFGELGIARTAMTTFTLLAGSNLGFATARAVSALRAVDAERAGRVIGLLFNVCMIVSAVVTVACVLLSGTIARALGAPELAAPLAVSALFVVFASVTAVQIGTLIGFEAFSAAGWQIALEGLLIGAFMIAGAHFGGVLGAMIGTVAAGAVSFAIKGREIARVCREHRVTIRHRGVASELPIIRTLVIPSVILGISAQPFAFLGRALLARSPNGMAEVAVFAAAFPWGAAALMIPSQIARPAMPILSNLLATGERSGFRRLLRDTLLASAGAAALVAVPAMVLSPWIMRAYGAGFGRGAMVLVLIAISSLAGSVSAALRAALVATGNVWSQAGQSVAWGVTLVGVFLLMRSRGAVALGAAYIAAFGVTLVLQVLLTRSAVARAALSSTVGADLARPGLVDDAEVVSEIE
jgi:O-antigen/teichoic acid export membrane protein